MCGFHDFAVSVSRKDQHIKKHRTIYETGILKQLESWRPWLIQ